MGARGRHGQSCSSWNCDCVDSRKRWLINGELASLFSDSQRAKETASSFVIKKLAISERNIVGA